MPVGTNPVLSATDGMIESSNILPVGTSPVSSTTARIIENPDVKSWTSIPNVVPLTTVFTYEPSCMDRWILPEYYVEYTGPITIYSTSPSGTSSIDTFWTACQPFSYQEAYSPGVCPEQMRLAAITRSLGTINGSTLTRWYGACCSSELAFSNICQTSFTTDVEAFAPMTAVRTPIIRDGSGGSSIVAPSTWSGYFDYVEDTVTITNNQSITRTSFIRTVSNITTLTSAVALADVINVIWEETDLPKFPPAYAASLAKRIGVSFTPSATPGSSSSLPSQTASPSPSILSWKGLSKGGRAGVGVGSAVAFLIAIALIAFLVLRKRRKNRNPTASFSHDSYHPEMEDQDASLATRKWYLRGKWRSEIETPKDKPGELDSRSVRVVGGPPQELDATSNVNGQN